MKRKVVLTVSILLLANVFLTGCCLKHDWQEADCTTPKTCFKCGKEEGEALGHDWQEATCTEPKTCSVCGKTKGEALEHTWEEATCTEPKTCSVCGRTEGEALGHTWQEATCQNPKTCSVCGMTEGGLAEHKWQEATCQKPKTCSVCGTQEGGLGEHRTGVAATYWSAAVCSVCGAPFGERLVPAFIRNGIDINVSYGQTCDYLTGSEAGNATTGQAFFELADAVDQGNGYSVVRGQITIKFADNEARMRGSKISYGMSDYYLGTLNGRKENLSDGVKYFFSVDYDGTVYSDCSATIRLSYERPAITASLVGPETWWTMAYELYVPSGYDGCVIFLADARQSISNLKDAQLFFRIE